MTASHRRTQLNMLTVGRALEDMGPQKFSKMRDKAEVIARTVVSQVDFYHSADCNANHRQLLETMIGAAIWYLPQGQLFWTGRVSVGALYAIAESSEPQRVKLTQDHEYPRKMAANQLFNVDWSEVPDATEFIITRYVEVYGRFNYVLPVENKKLVPYQKIDRFRSPMQSYRQAGVELRNVTPDELKRAQRGDRKLTQDLLNRTE